MDCPKCKACKSVIKKGFFRHLTIPGGKSQRYRCKKCRHCFSQTNGTLSARQRRPDLHRPVFNLMVSGVSQRRIALLCSTTQTTVARKLVLLAKFANLIHDERLARMEGAVKMADFDEMETSEHTKCKPVAIAAAVEEPSRIILRLKAASMPAKGRLAKMSRRRYGRRKDDRRAALVSVLQDIAKVAVRDLVIKSDLCPRYPQLVARHLPTAEHRRFKGRRGCVVGLGELKAGGKDPLFSLNQTCAMVRDNLKCLARRTWCTTKRIDRLQCRLDLYVCAHNAKIDLKAEGKRRRSRVGHSRGRPWPLECLAISA
ncbi:MAG: hypothetical protein RIQ81_31 [Pseudomonadota bacterium]